MTEYTYIVYDGRANYDEDEAAILEVISGMSKNKAKKYFSHEYRDTDAVLFQYETNDENELVNGKRLISIY